MSHHRRTIRPEPQLNIDAIIRTVRWAGGLTAIVAIGTALLWGVCSHGGTVLWILITGLIGFLAMDVVQEATGLMTGPRPAPGPTPRTAAARLGQGRALAARLVHRLRTRWSGQARRAMSLARVLGARLGAALSPTDHLADRTGRTAAPATSAARPPAGRPSPEHRPTAVLLIGVDRFLDVADPTRDLTALVDVSRVAPLVEQRSRATARTGDGCLSQGGRPLTLILSDVSTAREALAVAHRIREALGRPFRVNGLDLDVRTSIGIAVDPSPSGDHREVMRRAGTALARARRLGGNRIEVHTDWTGLPGARVDPTEDDPVTALAAGQIVPWYQPMVDLRTGTIVGAETLARWMHPRRGLLLPEEFAGRLAERGLGPELDERMLDAALRLTRRLLSTTGTRFPLAVNLGDPVAHLPVVLEAARAASGDPSLRHRITLEISEHAVLADPADTLRALARMRAAGFAIALDDAGPGFWSLALAPDLPLDMVKLDRRLVRGMATDAADAAVVSQVIGLAGRLDPVPRVVAGGVEDAADVRRLVDAGVPVAQGYWYAAAVPAEELERWLRLGPPWRSRHGADHRPPRRSDPSPSHQPSSGPFPPDPAGPGPSSPEVDTTGDLFTPGNGLIGVKYLGLTPNRNEVRLARQRDPF